jgi:hypothetical protein
MVKMGIVEWVILTPMEFNTGAAFFEPQAVIAGIKINAVITANK